jgi:predicted dehydrogenase
MEKVKIAVVGVRNYASIYLNNIKQLESEVLLQLTGVVVRDQIKNAEKVHELKSQGVEIFDSYDSLLKQGINSVNIIALPTSIHTHADLAIKGMRSGYSILLEKPPALTIEQIDKIIKVEKETGKFCSIAFQFIHARSIRKLKRYLLEGKIGKIKNIACKGYWPRYKSYYNRNEWAGKIFYDGRIILDGPMQNAFAHFLNNMLFLAADEFNQSAKLKSVRAELYRARSYIQADDTSCLEAETDKDIKIYLYATHASESNQDPYMEITGTKGKVTWQYDETTKLFLDDGEDIVFDNNGIDPRLEVLRIAAKTCLGDLDKPYSTPENSRNFVVAINGAYDSAKKILQIPEKIISEFKTVTGEFKTVVNNIENIMDEAFKERKLLSDIGVKWARKTDTVNIENYKEFNPFK